ncbi:MAG: Uma2 family endonuclease [Snowella sp.]|nr:Uma2 family endonuclease [Snowella sp.]
MTITLEKTIANDSSFLLSGIAWEQLESLESAFATIAGVRLTYLDGYLDIMTLSQEHEDIKSTIGLLLETYLREKQIRFYKRGSATLGNKAIAARKEPDESYNLMTRKVVPDLVIEVIISSGSLNILELYQRLGVPEVWLWKDEQLQVYCLQDTYHKSEQSQLLPHLPLAQLNQYINHQDQYDAIVAFTQSLR